jgi:predicted TIM-barrel fold metal-dependent hydrolase
MKIDIFSHMIPKKYLDMLVKKAKINTSNLEGLVNLNPALTDVDVRLRRIERYPEMLEVLVPAIAPLETFMSADDALDLAKVNNDEMAELVARHPDKFMAAVALLPLNNIDVALKEIERACMGLGMRGIVVNPTINGEPLDLPKFRPIFSQMDLYDLPIWIHPSYSPIIQTSLTKGIADSSTNKFLNWPVETSITMLRLINSGIFKEYPKIKIITHHCGGLTPFCGDRIKLRDDDLRKFYGDTALLSTTAPLMCGYSFFGADHLVFGTDTNEGRPHHGVTWDEIRAIEQLDIPIQDKDKIFERNASRLLRTGL